MSQRLTDRIELLLLEGHLTAASAHHLRNRLEKIFGDAKHAASTSPPAPTKQCAVPVALNPRAGGRPTVVVSADEHCADERPAGESAATWERTQSDGGTDPCTLVISADEEVARLHLEITTPEASTNPCRLEVNSEMSARLSVDIAARSA